MLHPVWLYYTASLYSDRGHGKLRKPENQIHTINVHSNVVPFKPLLKIWKKIFNVLTTDLYSLCKYTVVITNILTVLYKSSKGYTNWTRKKKASSFRGLFNAFSLSDTWRYDLTFLWVNERGVRRSMVYGDRIGRRIMLCYTLSPLLLNLMHSFCVDFILMDWFMCNVLSFFVFFVKTLRKMHYGKE